MARDCPIKGRAIYLDCLECEDKECRKRFKYDQIVIGIDQSYKNTGISVSCDGELRKVTSIDLERYDNKSDKRRVLSQKLDSLLRSVCPKGKRVVCIIERIRLRSQGFLNIDYIKSIGALNSVIVDVMDSYEVPVFSVDTRCWKAQVVGTSKGAPNDYEVPEEKWPTVKWLIDLGWRKAILVNMDGTRKKKGIFERKGHKYQFNNDAADSAAISQFWFVGDHDKLDRET